jgi:hypothetical protein
MSQAAIGVGDYQNAASACGLRKSRGMIGWSTDSRGHEFMLSRLDMRKRGLPLMDAIEFHLDLGCQLKD